MEFLDLGAGTCLVPYQEAWDLQRELHADVVADRRPSTVVLVEHESVYTAGRRTASWDRPVDGTPVVDVDRGGRITWHGQGQLVAYPVVRLRTPVDVVAYVRRLEQAVIDVCAGLELEAGRVEGRSGVWFPADGVLGAGLGEGGTVGRRERKVAAIGVRVAQGVTMHGLALNCEPDLAEFGRIVPCGIPDADVTSLSLETGRRVSIREVAPMLRRALEAALADVVTDVTHVVTGSTATRDGVGETSGSAAPA